MTFAELVLAVHDWSRRLPFARVRDAIKRQLDSEEGVEGLRRGFPVEAAWIMIQLGLGPGMRPVVFCDQAPVLEVDCKAEAGAEIPRLHAADEPAPELDRKAELEIIPPPPRKSRKARPAAGGRARPGQEQRGRPSKRAQALVCEELADGPKPEVEIEAAARAAEIPERALIAAADALGVRTRKGQWWIPGQTSEW